MEITNKMLWREAFRGGVLLGLILMGLQLLQHVVMSAESTILSFIVNVAYVAIYITLIFVLTKRTASLADATHGFSWGRCMVFVFEMMIFVGIILGIYHSVMNNFIYPGFIENTMRESVSKMIENPMLGSMMSSMDKESYIVSMTGMMKNPFLLIIVSVITALVQGGFAGLFTSMLAKREPELFND